jgi:hypothetical protein
MSMTGGAFSRPASATVSGLVTTAAQIYAGLKTFNDGVAAPAITGLTPPGGAMGAFDVAVKVGTRSLRAVNTVGSKLLSIRDGIGDVSETEYAYFSPIFAAGASAFRANLVLDQKGQTHVGALALINTGVGDTGIFFEGAASSGGAHMGLGSQGTRGLLTSSTNRGQSWYVNSAAYQTPRAVYDWEAAEDANQRVAPFLRFQSDALHTGDLMRVFKGASQAFSIDASGGLRWGTAAGNAKLFGAGSGNVWLQIDDSNGINGYYAGHQFSLLNGFGVNTTLTVGSTLFLNTGGNARPAADAANRGQLWYSRSGAGLADTLEVCLKSAADTYSWKTIITG